MGDHVLDPALTDYRKRILCVVCDVTDMLTEGRNTIGVMLGNGWYSEKIRPSDKIQCFGDSPRLLLQMNIEFTDGMRARIKSDETWKVSGGPIICSNFCGGETYDARLEKPGEPFSDCYLTHQKETKSQES